jgi:hypothetical protein
MENSSIIIIAILVLIFLGMLHSNSYVIPTTTSTTKTVVVHGQPTYNKRYPTPIHYNAYKAQYY